MVTLTYVETVDIPLNGQARATLLVDPRLPSGFLGYDAILATARQPYLSGSPYSKGPDFVAIVDTGPPNFPGGPKPSSPMFHVTVQSLNNQPWAGSVHVDCLLFYEAP